MKAKLIKLPFTPERVVFTLAYLLFSPISSLECSVMVGVIRGCDGGVLSLAEGGEAVKKGLGVNSSSFAVCLSRLQQKGLIKKSRGVVIINPVFVGCLNSDSQYLVRFLAEGK